ncbi:MAG: substrate-binding domain-containing protein [Anaerolineae bacterium]|nr:substrate-binding domain-containing protein [Anaerolineae bacterium]
MTSLKRLIGLCVLIALVISPALIHAQDDAAITVVGSGIAAPLFEALVDAGVSSANVDVQVTGTNAGLEQLCAGSADIALSTRAINDGEDVNCVNNNVAYVELLLGDVAAVVIANPDDAFAQCLSIANLNTIFAPSAAGQITTWQVIDPTAGVPLSVSVPPSSSPVSAIFDGLINGDGLRADATVETDEQAIVSTVAGTSGALGVVNFTTALAAGDAVKMLPLGVSDTGACVEPSAETIGGGQYTASERIYAYANGALLEQPQASALLAFLGTEPAANVAADQGFLPASADDLARNATIVANAETGHQFSVAPFEFTIPPGVVGAISYAGDSAANDLLSTVTSTFQSAFAGVTHTITLNGRVDGARRFCNGEVDAIALTAPLTDEQAGNCAANNVVPVEFELGDQAVVLVANAENDYLACLTTQQIATIWGSTSAELPTTWDQVDASFPATTMTLIAAGEGDEVTDLLLTDAAGVSIPLRDDATMNRDPLYRAASVAVIDGAITYMSWGQYQTLISLGQDNIQLVSVDSGAGCVEPTDATIADGSYALSQSLKLVVSQASLRRPEVQSLVWYMYSDANYATLSSSGFGGIALTDLPAIRESLQTAFDEAGAAAPPPTAEPAADATPTSAG